jgi:hypothetical protein
VRGGGANGGVSGISILLVGLPVMWGEIISAAIADEPRMRIVHGAPPAAELGQYIRQHDISTVIFAAGNHDLEDTGIAGLLRVNPRLGLVAVDGRENRAVVHFLAPAHAVFAGLDASTLIAAIRASAGARGE